MVSLQPGQRGSLVYAPRPAPRPCLQTMEDSRFLIIAGLCSFVISTTDVSQCNEDSRLKTNKVKGRRAHSSPGAQKRRGTRESCQTLYRWVGEVYVHALSSPTHSSLYHGWDPHETHTQIQTHLAAAEPGPCVLASVNKTRQYANMS